jgi:hypothetical protein
MAMKKEVDELEDELRPSYDFSKMAGGARGKYVERYRSGTNVVLLDHDVAQAFPTSESVNDALRLLLRVAQRQQSNESVGVE